MIERIFTVLPFCARVASKNGYNYSNFIRNFAQIFVTMAFESKKSYIKSSNLSIDDFTFRISHLKSAWSTSMSTQYVDIKIDGNKIVGVRFSTRNSFSIPLDKLYQAYTELTEINTTTLKPYIDRVQSPALAILIYIGAIAEPGKEPLVFTPSYTIKEQLDQKKAKQKAVQAQYAAEHPIEHKVSQISNFYKKHKKILFVCFIIGCFFVGYLLQPKGEGLYESPHYPCWSIRNEANNYIKGRLRNPDSYKVDSWYMRDCNVDSETRRYMLLIEYRAKNGFGGYGQGRATFYLDNKGHITDVNMTD